MLSNLSHKLAAAVVGKAETETWVITLSYSTKGKKKTTWGEAWARSEGVWHWRHYAIQRIGLHNLFLSTYFNLGNSVALQSQLHGSVGITVTKTVDFALKTNSLWSFESVYEFLFPVLINLKGLKNSETPLPRMKTVAASHLRYNILFRAWQRNCLSFAWVQCGPPSCSITSLHTLYVPGDLVIYLCSGHVCDVLYWKETANNFVS